MTNCKRAEDCPDADQHTPHPSGFLEHAEWANMMLNRGAKQRRCPTCGFCAVWTPPRRPMPTSRGVR